MKPVSHVAAIACAAFFQMTTPSYAEPEVRLEWSQSSNALALPGSSSIEASPGDTLTLSVIVDIDSDGFHGADFGLLFNAGLIGVSAVECPSPPHLVAGFCRSSDGTPFVPLVPGVTIGPGVMGRFEAVGAVPTFSPSSLVIGRADFSVSSPGPVVAIYGPDGFVLDGTLGSHQPFAEANVVDFGEGAKCPTNPPACDVPGTSKLELRDKNSDGPGVGDRLIWKYLRGPAQTQGEFGDPTTTARYKLCVYDGLGLAATAEIAAGGGCGAKPCWKDLPGRGYRFADSSAAQDGVSKIVLKADPTRARSSIVIVGKGANLDFSPSRPPLDTTSGVSVRLVSPGTPKCWGADFEPDDVTRNDAMRFKAKMN